MTAPAVDDWELVAQARSDRAAFGELWRRHHSMIFGWIYVRVPGRETAEDLAAETFLRALRSLDRVQDTGHPFAAWLVTIARNLVYDHHKSSRVRLAKDVQPLDDDRVLNIPCPRVSPEQQVEARRLVAGALIPLCPADRDIVVQRYLYGLRPGDIAAVDGRSVGAVKAQQVRALRNLRAQLGEAS